MLKSAGALTKQETESGGNREKFNSMMQFHQGEGRLGNIILFFLKMLIKIFSGSKIIMFKKARK